MKAGEFADGLAAAYADNEGAGDPRTSGWWGSGGWCNCGALDEEAGTDAYGPCGLRAFVAGDGPLGAHRAK